MGPAHRQAPVVVGIPKEALARLEPGCTPKPRLGETVQLSALLHRLSPSKSKLALAPGDLLLVACPEGSMSPHGRCPPQYRLKGLGSVEADRGCNASMPRFSVWEARLALAADGVIFKGCSGKVYSAGSGLFSRGSNRMCCGCQQCGVSCFIVLVGVAECSRPWTEPDVAPQVRSNSCFCECPWCLGMHFAICMPVVRSEVGSRAGA